VPNPMSRIRILRNRQEFRACALTGKLAGSREKVTFDRVLRAAQGRESARPTVRGGPAHRPRARAVGALAPRIATPQNDETAAEAAVSWWRRRESNLKQGRVTARCLRAIARLGQARGRDTRRLTPR
jgi:hypothetical protein